jgi:hypothetical protein
VVAAAFHARAAAELELVCGAELDPPSTSPPAIDTGTLAFTPFWCAFAFESAFWFVVAD